MLLSLSQRTPLGLRPSGRVSFCIYTPDWRCSSCLRTDASRFRSDPDASGVNFDAVGRLDGASRHGRSPPRSLERPFLALDRVAALAEARATVSEHRAGPGPQASSAAPSVQRAPSRHRGGLAAALRGERRPSPPSPPSELPWPLGVPLSVDLHGHLASSPSGPGAHFTVSPKAGPLAANPLAPPNPGRGSLRRVSGWQARWVRGGRCPPPALGTRHSPSRTGPLVAARQPSRCSRVRGSPPPLAAFPVFCA